jgi:vacuolar protein sorting-associated protein 8
VVAVEPLAAWPHQLLAMATLSKAIVVQLRPRTRVLFSHPLAPAPHPSLPLLAWQRVVIQVADGRRVLDPVLAFGRLDTFFFYQVRPKYRGGEEF